MRLQVIHILPGRIRLKVPALKADPVRARAVQERIAPKAGIRKVEVNPATGSVLVFFDESIGLASLGSLQELFPSLSLTELQDRLTAFARGPTPRADAAEDIAELFRRANAEVARVMDGLDLRVLVPLALIALAMLQLLSGKTAWPRWYDFLWFAFSSFLLLNRPGSSPESVG